jgi:single-strand DNA-binding protein
MNHVTLIGNLGKEPEIGESKAGVPYARLSLCTNLSYKKPDGTRETRADWHRIVAFNGLANSLRSLGKGDRIAVHGRLQTSSYEEHGERRWSVEIIALEIEFQKLLGRTEDDDRGPTYDGDFAE